MSDRAAGWEGVAGAYVAPMSHLDLTFMGSVEECLSRGAKVFSAALELLDRQPEFCFFLEYVLFLEAYHALQPEQAARLDEYIRRRRVELGAEWSGIFITQEDEENLVRNVLYAKRYARQRYGIELETLQLSDIPGAIPQLPQLCTGLGIQNLVLTRCAPPDTLFWYEAPGGQRVLTWSADTYNQAGRFGLHLSVAAMRERGLAARLAAAEGQAPPLLYYGSDLFLPPPQLVPNVLDWNAGAKGGDSEGSRGRLCVTTPTGYFRAIRAAGLERTAPVRRGELPSTWLYVEPDHAHVSRWDSIAARALDAAERLSTLAWLHLGLAYPKAELEALWKAQLLARDHNFGGKGAGEGQPRKLAERRDVYYRARRLQARAMGAVAERVAAPRESVPLVVFNTLNWPRTGLVRAHVTFYPAVDPARRDLLPPEQALVLRDPQGRSVPFQVIADRRGTLGELDLAFVARDVPGLGYAAYTLEPAPPEEAARVEAAAGPAAPRRVDQPWFGATPPQMVLENGLVRLAIDRADGRARLYDLRPAAGGPPPAVTGGSGTAAPMPGLAGGSRSTGAARPQPRLVVDGLRLEGRHELPEVMQSPPRALSYDAPERERVEAAVLSQAPGETPLEVVEHGPVLATLAVRQLVLGVPAELRYTLYRELPWVDAEVRLDWDVRRFGRIELAYEVPLAGARVHYGLPFGAGSFDPESLLPGAGPIRGDEAVPASWQRTREITRWLSIDTAAAGVAMATDHRWTRIDPLPDAGGVAVRACLVRGGRMRPAAPETDGDDPRVRLVFRFRFQPHDGGWQAARVPRAGWEAVQPLLCYTVNDTWSPKSLPRAAALATIAPLDGGAGDALLTCLKQSEDGAAAIARWYEPAGAPCTVAVHLATGPGQPPAGAVERVDLLEAPLPAAGSGRGEEVAVPVAAWEIVTVRARLRPP